MSSSFQLPLPPPPSSPPPRITEHKLQPPPLPTGEIKQPIGAQILNAGQALAKQSESNKTLAKTVSPVSKEDLKNYPGSHGEISRADAVKLLENKPVGSWLIRYSKEKLVISKKIADTGTLDEKYKHIDSVEIGEKEKKFPYAISNFTVDALKRMESFGEQIVLPENISTQQTPASPIIPSASLPNPHNIENHPAFIGPEPYPSQLAENSLRGNEFPIGTWIIRKNGKGQLTITVKTDVNKFEHMTSISIGGRHQNIANLSIEISKIISEQNCYLYPIKIQKQQSPGDNLLFLNLLHLQEENRSRH